MIRALRAPLQVRAGLCACILSVPLSSYAQQASSSSSAAPSSAAPSSAPAQSAAPAAQIVSPAPKPPFPNRLNSVLPSWLRTRGEFRERMEGFDGANFNSTRDDLYYLTRFRFGATVTASKSLSFQAQVQDARVGKKTVGATGTPFRAPFDLRLGFADIGSSSGPVTLRAGRQELVYGDQRLVGHLSWTNAARVFDAVKVTMRGKTASLDVFGASVVRTIEDGFDKSGAGNRFAGAYLTMPKLVKNGSLEPYYFFRRDTNLPGEVGVVGDLKGNTAGVRFAGKLPLALDYNVEMAVQGGSLGSNDVQAWAGHWQLRESLSGPGSIKLIGEFNYASGDENPTDGVRGTFDQLYPTGHDKYGLADQIGWKNIQHARAGFEFSPFKATPITTSYHSWWLAEKRDGIYTAGGAPLARVISGAASGHVGEEIDVQVSRALTPQMQVSGGYAHIFPGAFLEQATPGASYNYPYVQVTYVFLAER